MREKIIFDGRIDGSSKEIQKSINLFMFENIGLPGIDYKVEDENQKRLYVIYPPQDQNRIINGYTEITTLSLSENSPVNLRIVSCRQELDLLFFQISQRIQAKFIVKGYPPGILSTSWRELVSQGFISPLANNEKEILLPGYKKVDPHMVVGKYGTYRDLTKEEVTIIVERCKEYQQRGGTIVSYYNDSLPPAIQSKFSLETLKSWLKDKKFQSTDKKPTRKSTR